MNTNYNIEEIVKEYADKIFGFCVNRLNNIDDAQDLSQEILLEIVRCLPKSTISDVNAWIWKIARNRYAMRLNKPQNITISLDDNIVIDMLIDDRELLKGDNSDEINAVFTAVHNLAKSHREILIDCYVNGLSYFKMAEKNKTICKYHENKDFLRQTEAERKVANDNERNCKNL